MVISAKSQHNQTNENSKALIKASLGSNKDILTDTN